MATNWSMATAGGTETLDSSPKLFVYYILRGRYIIGLQCMVISSHVTSPIASAITLATGHTRSWEPGEVLKLAVVAIRALSKINLR